MDDVESFFKGYGDIESISLKPGYGKKYNNMELKETQNFKVSSQWHIDEMLKELSKILMARKWLERKLIFNMPKVKVLFET